MTIDYDHDRFYRKGGGHSHCHQSLSNNNSTIQRFNNQQFTIFASELKNNEKWQRI